MQLLHMNILKAYKSNESYSSMRIMRSKEPKLYILYYKGTRDEEFLKVALNDIDKNYIKTISIDELGIKD